MKQKKISTGLIEFDNVDMVESANKIQTLSKNTPFSYVVTPNVDHLSRLCGTRPSDLLYQVYSNAAVTLCDSRIVEKMLAIVGHKIKAVVPGSDLTQYLFDKVLAAEDNILLIGGSDEDVAELKRRYPHLTLQHINPTMGFINKPDEVEQLIQQIKTIAADYVFLAVGSPRQEILAYRLQQAGVERGVALCIGASINFIIGVESRAPQWMQVLHLEWFYRMLQDPKRLVLRYSSNALALPKVLMGLSKKR